MSRRTTSLRAAAAGLAAAFALGACGGEPAAPDASAGSSPDPAASMAPTLDPMATVDPESVCRRIDELELAVARLRGVELKIVNRTALDIAFDSVEMAYDELASSELGEFEDELEDPLTRLSYRLGEVELAVEDFRTNSRPRRAGPHVEKDAETFAGDLAAFRVLARC